MTYQYMSPKPNRRTVWLMFVLGIAIGGGFAYVLINPDNILDTFANRVCTRNVIDDDVLPAPGKANRVIYDVEHLLDDPIAYEQDEIIEDIE